MRVEHEPAVQDHIHDGGEWSRDSGDQLKDETNMENQMANIMKQLTQTRVNRY